MVFPRGEFSTRGLGALKAAGFDAAANTTPWPVDAGENRLTVRDLLQVAVTHYEDFPIFVRRYPVDIFDHAFDALFQKPVLAVEHHGYFRHGCGPLVQVMRELSTLKTNLTWLPLGQAVAASCILRQTGDGQYAVRHLTRTLHLTNPTVIDWYLSLEKPAAGESIKAVMINGEEVPFGIVSCELKYEHVLPAGREMQVRIVFHPKPKVVWHPSVKYRLATWLRRRLSDVRDNQLARSEWLLAVAQKIKGLLTS